MRRDIHAVRPAVEEVERRALLSGGMHYPHPHPHPAAAAAGPAVIPLEGTVRGHYHAIPGPADAGPTVVANGNGRIRGIGPTRAHGEVHGIGLILQGQAQGDVILKGRRGKVVLHLTGSPFQGGFQGLPAVFSFSITGGTGKYRNAHDNGSGTLAIMPGPGGMTSAYGKFTLTLTPHPLPL